MMNNRLKLRMIIFDLKMIWARFKLSGRLCWILGHRIEPLVENSENVDRQRHCARCRIRPAPPVTFPKTEFPIIVKSAKNRGKGLPGAPSVERGRLEGYRTMAGTWKK